MKHDMSYIFDLTGVLFKIDKFTLIRKLGLWRTFMYALTHRKNPVNRYLEAMSELSKSEPYKEPQLQHHRYTFPRCVSELLLGNTNGATVANELHNRLNDLDLEGFFSSEREFEFIKRITTLAFANGNHIPSFKPVQPMVNFLKILRQNPANRLFLLSNLDEPTYRHLEHTYPDFFALFDGITISSLVHMIKPYSPIYQHVINTYSINPQKALFVDDQPENVAAAEKLGIKAMLFSSPNQLISQINKLAKNL